MNRRTKGGKDTEFSNLVAVKRLESPVNAVTRAADYLFI